MDWTVGPGTHTSADTGAVRPDRNSVALLRTIRRCHCRPNHGTGISRSMSPRANGPIHFRSCLEVASGALTGGTDFGGVAVGEDMASLLWLDQKWSCRFQHRIYITSSAVMDNRDRRDAEIASGSAR